METPHLIFGGETYIYELLRHTLNGVLIGYTTSISLFKYLLVCIKGGGTSPPPPPLHLLILCFPLCIIV